LPWLMQLVFMALIRRMLLRKPIENLSPDSITLKAKPKSRVVELQRDDSAEMDAIWEEAKKFES